MAPVLTRLSSGGGFGFSKITVASSAASAYAVSRSLRFNSADSAYLSRTPSSSGNKKTCTISAWVKRSKLGATQMVFTSRGPGNPTAGPRDSLLHFDSNDTVTVYFADGTYVLTTTQVFRDLSAWYHIVVAIDTTQATSTNRVKLYVNGSQVTTFSSSSYPAQDYEFSSWNVGSQIQYIGCDEYINRRLFFDGYLADIHFIDGQALTPSSFAETDATTGAWNPKAYSGSYNVGVGAVNGFHLDFADNSSTTSGSNTGIGKDTSGNGHYWNSSGLSVTAGAGNDSLIDTPTNGTQTDTGLGGEVVGNYCTLNPLDKGSAISLANGNLYCTSSTASHHTVKGTIGVSTGKWYWEVTVDARSNETIGVANAGFPISGSFISNPGSANSSGIYAGDFSQGSVLGFALDCDSGKLFIAENNTWKNSGNPVTGANPWYGSLTSGPYFPALNLYDLGTDPQYTVNFGQRPFAYTAPSGFKALCTANLPEGSITTSGTFTGNASADGPFIYLNGVPTAMTINGNAVTFGTQADKLSNGFKLRTSSASYNTSGSNTYSITTTGDKFKNARAQTNP